MNRLPASVLPNDLRAPTFDVPPGRVDAPVHETPNYSFFVPLHYEPNYAYPLIVWLHSEGDCERQLSRVMPQISMRNYTAVAPRGTLQLPAREIGDEASRFTWRQTQAEIDRACHRVLEAVDLAQRRFRVHTDRIFLAGAGCGGTMALRAALRTPERFRGVLSLGGGFPNGLAPLARLPAARQLPLFLAMGRQCQNYPQSAVCSDLRLAHTAGLNVTLRQYPGTDELQEIMLADMDRWAMDLLASDREASVVAS